MNVTAVLCAWSLLFVNQFSVFDSIPLAVTLMGLLAIISFVGLIIGRARLYKDIWLTDVAPGHLDHGGAGVSLLSAF